jgi:benzodiazapine receptor
MKSLQIGAIMVSKKQVFFQGINIVAFIVTVVVNVLAGSTTLLNGLTSGEVSDLYPTLITPAGFTFAIWGIIYALLLVFIVYQSLPRNRDKPFLNQISILFALSGIWNISWLFLWHFQLIIYSLILMIALLATLIIIYLRLNIGRADVTLKEKISVHLPFSVYLGWISIATIANVAVTLTFIGWDGWGIQPVNWTIIIIAMALILTLVVLATRRDLAYSLVIIWALVGIITKQIEYPNIILAAEGSIAILLIATVAAAAISQLKR